MSFWFQTDSTQIQDPKRKFRFALYFQGIDPDGGLAWYAKSVNKPSFTLTAAEHKYLNHTFYYPGSVTWETVTATLVDPVDPDMTATLSAILEGSGYKLPATPDQENMSTISKAQSIGALGQDTIIQLNSEGESLEEWTLHNAFITSVKYGDLAYDGDDLSELTVEMRYDWASVSTRGQSQTTTVDNSTEFFKV